MFKAGDFVKIIHKERKTPVMVDGHRLYKYKNHVKIGKILKMYNKDCMLEYIKPSGTSIIIDRFCLRNTFPMDHIVEEEEILVPAYRKDKI